MSKLHLTSLLALGLVWLPAGYMAPAAAADCGSVTLASMNWKSAEVLASIDNIILGTGYGCSVEVVPGDTVPSLTSMTEKAQPDIAPEAWVDLQPEVVNRGVSEGKLVVAANSLSDGGVQGWFIPKYTADANPDIKTIDDALKRPDLFPAPEDSSKGAVFNGPAGWGGTLVTGQLFKAYEGDKAGFVLVDTGSAAGLDGSLARAYERKEGWLGYYWAPTALLGKYEMVKLDHGVAHDADEWKRCNTVADCPDPKRNDWPRDTVQTLVTGAFAERAGTALDYLKARSWTNDTVNELLAWMEDNQATGDEGARHFLRTKEDVWTAWVPAEVADKVKAAVK